MESQERIVWTAKNQSLKVVAKQFLVANIVLGVLRSCRDEPPQKRKTKKSQGWLFDVQALEGEWNRKRR